MMGFITRLAKPTLKIVAKNIPIPGAGEAISLASRLSRGTGTGVFLQVGELVHEVIAFKALFDGAMADGVLSEEELKELGLALGDIEQKAKGVIKGS